MDNHLTDSYIEVLLQGSHIEVLLLDKHTGVNPSADIRVLGLGRSQIVREPRSLMEPWWMIPQA